MTRSIRADQCLHTHPNYRQGKEQATKPSQHRQPPHPVLGLTQCLIARNVHGLTKIKVSRAAESGLPERSRTAKRLTKRSVGVGSIACLDGYRKLLTPLVSQIMKSSRTCRVLSTTNPTMIASSTKPSNGVTSGIKSNGSIK